MLKLRIGVLTFMFLAGMAMTARAIVPAPPVNQTLGMEDTSFNDLTEADCRECHGSGVNDRHHLLYNKPIPIMTVVPYPELTTNYPTMPYQYNCIGCHGDGIFAPEDYRAERDCTECHNTNSPHHTTAAANAGDCKACHGDLVDNMDDGHYIPDYDPSQMTPQPSRGDADQRNSYNNGAGACNYCHDSDTAPGGAGTGTVILSNHDNHHGTNLVDFGNKCDWCHDPIPDLDITNDDWPQPLSIRTCEGCHGPDSLHNIQADSPNPANPGTIVVDGEDAGYGHVGRNQGPGDSDCWGCHGYAMSSASAPGSGPVIPSIVSIDVSVMNAGANRVVFVSGSAFTNTAGATQFVSDVTLTAADGSSVILAPNIIDQGALTVTIPGSTAPGNYNLQAVKAEFASNPAVISIIPAPVVTDLTCAQGTATITGSGFVGYAEGSGTSVTGTIRTGRGKNKTTTTETGAVSSWTDTQIVAGFSACPVDVTVNTVYGSATSGDGGGDPPTGSCSDYSDAESCNDDSSCTWRVKKGRGSCRNAH